MSSALVLAGWLLLVAPRSPADIFHPERPISKWDHVASFPNREACDEQRDQMIVYIDTHQRARRAWIRPRRRSCCAVSLAMIPPWPNSEFSSTNPKPPLIRPITFRILRASDKKLRMKPRHEGGRLGPQASAWIDGRSTAYKVRTSPLTLHLPRTRDRLWAS